MTFYRLGGDPVIEARKAQIVAGLYKWIHQRPGLEFGNYGDVSAYRSEVRRIGRQLQDARTLLRAVEWRDSITADDILAATSAYSGRLSIKETVTDKGSTFAINYCTGQYWPTEYRAAVCAVLGQVLFNAWRANCPSTGLGFVSPGTWIRENLKREFGRTLQARWMD